MWSYVFNSICFKKFRNPEKLSLINQYQTGKEHILKLVDVAFYLKLINQFKIIKQIVLRNEIHQFSLDHLKKLQMPVDASLSTLISKKEENTKKVIDYFKEKLDGKILDETDELLFDSLDNQIKDKILTV